MNTPLTEQYLQSLEGIQQVGVSPFFYTRLKGRMQQHATPRLQPSFAIILLTVSLAINIFFLSGIFNQPQHNTSPAQAFAKTYNLAGDYNY